MKVLSRVIIFAASVITTTARPETSWTPPPSRFAEYEWTNATPSWAKTRQERSGTVVWFYKEMTQEEALPVLLRTLDRGETWLQLIAAGEIQRLTIPLPADFGGKVWDWYEHIDVSNYPDEQNRLSDVQKDRIALKFSLALLLYKADRQRGAATLQQMSAEGKPVFMKTMALEALKHLKQSEQKAEPPARPYGSPAAGSPSGQP
jgi:hypothetical protein